MSDNQEVNHSDREKSSFYKFVIFALFIVVCVAGVFIAGAGPVLLKAWHDIASVVIDKYFEIKNLVMQGGAAFSSLKM